LDIAEGTTSGPPVQTQVLGLRDEVSGSVVDRSVEGTAGPDPVDHLLTATAAAAYHTVCIELDEAFHHDPAEASAAAADQKSFACEQIGSEHGLEPPPRAREFV
jgi:hypothetical protein